MSTKPKGKNKDKQTRNEDIIKLYHHYKSKKVGKKTELFDLRKLKYTDPQIYNIIQSELKLDISVSRIADIIHKPNKR